MNDAEATKTIQQMVRFIRQEAEEKAAEIGISAEEEFAITKLQMLEAEKARVRREFDRRRAAAETRRKVEASKALNEARLRVLAAREAALQGLLAEARRRLAALSADAAAYAPLLAALAAQALARLGEPRALLRVRPEDAALAAAAAPRAAAAAAAALGGRPPEVELDARAPLPAGPAPGADAGDADAGACLGGCVAASADGRIAVSNTLDDRLRIVYGAQLPAVRRELFGAADEE